MAHGKTETVKENGWNMDNEGIRIKIQEKEAHCITQDRIVYQGTVRWLPSGL
jgi:hypothetical protein